MRRSRSCFCRSRSPTGRSFKDESIHYFIAPIVLPVNKAEWIHLWATDSLHASCVSGEPLPPNALVTFVLLLHSPMARRHDIPARDNTDELAIVIVIHDRQASHSFANHQCIRFAEGVILENNRMIPDREIAD